MYNVQLTCTFIVKETSVLHVWCRSLPGNESPCFKQSLILPLVTFLQLQALPYVTVAVYPESCCLVQKAFQFTLSFHYSMPHFFQSVAMKMKLTQNSYFFQITCFLPHFHLPSFHLLALLLFLPPLPPSFSLLFFFLIPFLLLLLHLLFFDVGPHSPCCLGWYWSFCVTQKRLILNFCTSSLYFPLPSQVLRWQECTTMPGIQVKWLLKPLCCCFSLSSVAAPYATAVLLGSCNSEATNSGSVALAVARKEFYSLIFTSNPL